LLALSFNHAQDLLLTTSLITYQQSLLSSISKIETNIHELTVVPEPPSTDAPEHQGRNRGGKGKDDGKAGLSKDEGRSPFL
jgi:hypothetical protein